MKNSYLTCCFYIFLSCFPLSVFASDVTVSVPNPTGEQIMQSTNDSLLLFDANVENEISALLSKPIKAEYSFTVNENGLLTNDQTMLSAGSKSLDEQICKKLTAISCKSPYQWLLQKTGITVSIKWAPNTLGVTSRLTRMQFGDLSDHLNYVVKKANFPSVQLEKLP